jgi:hypothetical protein
MALLIKPESFVKYNNIKIKTSFLNLEQDENKNVLKNKNIYKTEVIKKSSHNDFLTHQDYILDILIELRDFDEKNGTGLFNNISYNNLNSFILKNSF